MDESLVTILIVNFNGARHLRPCLAALEEQTYPHNRFEVILVDNASADDSCGLVRREFPWVRLVENPVNAGFAGGNNAGLSHARGRWLVLLNNDTIPDPFWLEELAAEMKPGRAVASKLVFAHDPGLVNSAGLQLLRDGRGADRGFKHRDRGQFESPGPVFAGCGAAIALDRATLRGPLFDPRYFLYYEDLDAFWRAGLAGFTTVYAPRSLVRHVHGGSAGDQSPLFRFHVERNRALTNLRNADLFLAVWNALALAARVGRSFAKWLAGRERGSLAWATGRGFLSFLALAPAVVVERYDTRLRKGGLTMRVILNGVSALKPKTGVGHTTVNLHRALVDASRGDAFWLYPGTAVSAVASRMLKGKKKPASKSGVARPRRVKSVAIEAAKAAYRESFRVAARWGRFELYHEPNFIPIRTHLPTVVTVHDLSVVLHPEWHPADRVRFHEKHFRSGIAAAEHVIVVSHAVRREMIEHLNFDPRRVSAIHNGIGSHYVPQSAEAVEAMRSRLGLPPRYFLTVGTIEPRKNLLTVMKAFCELPSDVRAACPLVLAGGWGWKSGPERELFEREAWPRGAIHLGYVADADLPSLYSGATALMYPSFYEGFGLPVAEMLACGGAVVASSADAVREVAGTHAPIVEPLDVDGWRRAMLRTAREPEWLDEYRRGGTRHAQGFTWQRAATETLRVYRQVLGEEVKPQPIRRAA